MHILHISNDFGGTEVYKNLYENLDLLGIKQTIYVPLNPRVLNRKGNHLIKFKTQGSRIIFSTTQKWYHRYLYSLKIKNVVRGLLSDVDMSSVSLVHTGTLCMTGAVAYEINKKFGTPYIVSIRNTDINAYYKILKWKRYYFYKIMQSAKKIVFISPQYKHDCFGKIFPKKIVADIEYKTEVIPNGIDSHYLDNRYCLKRSISDVVNIVYAGGFSGNKNLLRLIKAVIKLKSTGYNLRLLAIGKNLPNRKVDDQYIAAIENEAKNKDYIELLEYMRKDDLVFAYRRAHIFAMPSIFETFGLSYVEALSQGLPVIYTRGQGFDGFYKDGTIGCAVDALSVDDIAIGIKKVIDNYDIISQNVINLEIDEIFNWSKISKKYEAIYKRIITR